MNTAIIVLLTILVLAGIVWFTRWVVLTKVHVKTGTEVKIEKDEVLNEERKKVDEESWDTFNDNYPPGE